MSVRFTAIGVGSAVGIAMVVMTSTTASAAGTEHGRWELNETSGTIAADSSGYGHHGSSFDVGLDGQAYSFNGASSRVIVEDTSATAAGTLDPGASNFSFGVRLSMPNPPGVGDTDDVLRKGLASTKGGNYKLEVKRTKKGATVGRCVVKDSARVRAAIQSQPKLDLAGTGFNTVTCTKTTTGVSIQVNSAVPRTRTVTRLGSVSNTANLALAAKAESTASTGFDWFLGKMDYAWLKVG